MRQLSRLQKGMTLQCQSEVPAIRIRALNDAPLSTSGEYVLYWMIANRRLQSNFSLQRAIDWSNELQKPLIILEALRSGYRWASQRIHRFIIEGMADNAKALETHDVLYYPYVEPDHDEGKGLLKALSSRACVIITDNFPCFMLPRMSAAAAKQSKVRMEAIDSNGIYPMYDTDRVFTKAHSFRRHLQKTIVPHLQDFPLVDPLDAYDAGTAKLPEEITQRWPLRSLQELTKLDWIADLPIDQKVLPAPIKGGSQQAQQQLDDFLTMLPRYHEDRNHPDKDPSSGLSPYLHFGHISAHTIFTQCMQQDKWELDNIAEKPNGSRNGWWGASEAVEAFLDELITWREIGYNMCAHTDNYDQYESLPDWARKTMEEHLDDSREYIYSLEEFEQANTHDKVWNAAQRQLIQEGRIHNYLRMLWGKKIYEWTATPQDALSVMIELNNKYALDGRNPNSYSGIFWVLGRYDRAWGPERKVFGKIRFMSSENTARKLKAKEYFKTYG